MITKLKKASSALFHVDELGGVVRGWAYDPCEKGPARISLWLDGVERFHFDADEFRPDLATMGYRDGFCGFRFQMPDALCDGQEHVLLLTLGSDKRPMLPAPVSVVLEPPPDSPVEGCLDAVDDHFFVTGWVSDRDGGATVEILAGDRVLAEIQAELLRPDLVLAEKCGRGFRARIAPDALDAPVTVLSARSNGHALTGSVTIDAVKRASLSAEVMYDGRLKVKLSGWPVQRADFDVYIDGIQASSLVLTSRQNDALQSVPLTGYWDAPASLLDARHHVVQVCGRGALAGIRTDSLLVRWPCYRVHIDRVDECSVSGWAIRLGEPQSLRLTVRAEGMGSVEAYANQSRVDVAHALGLPNDRVGFSVQYGTALLGRQIEIFDADSGIALVRIRVDDPSRALVDLSRSAFDAEARGNPSPRKLLAAARAAMPVEPMVTVDYLPQDANEDGAHGVDVIVPVYSGASETVECIESVLASRNQTEYRLVVVNDRSPDERITQYLRRTATRYPDRMVLVERQCNGGFSEAVNIGMTIAGRRDVILLNADTVVHGDWVDRIVGIAATDANIGTVTPFSNNGEICSLPYLCKSVAVEEGSQLVSLDRHAANGTAKPIDLPVAVGYCMFIRRACIDEVGLFDAATWGRGYGEEVDFCLKASARGWRHVLAPNVFVIHRGGVSFGDEKLARIQENSRKIAERYPFYDRMIQAFLRMDPPAAARRRINLSILAERLPSQRVLHVTHAFGGGTERYVTDLARLYENSGYSNATLSFDAHGQSLLAVDTQRTGLSGLFMPRHQERYDSTEAEALIAQLEVMQFDRVHLHAPFGVPDALMQWITSQAEFEATIHDYAWICPRVTLRDRAGRLCGTDETACIECMTPNVAHPGLAAVVQATGRDIRGYREYFGRVLSRAQRVYTGGDDVVRRMRAAGIDANFRVVPHPLVESETAGRRKPAPRAPTGGPVRIALIGGISEIKGFFWLVDCAREALKRRLPIEFVVFGNTEDNAVLLAYPNIKVLGRYAEEDLHALLDSWMPDLALFLNLVPETFSYTLSSAFERGLWPVVTDIGVPAERVRRAGFGDVIPLDIPTDELLDRLLEIARGRHIVVNGAIESDRPVTLEEYRGA